MKDNRTIQELKDTRVKTTFKVEITLDLPYFDNKSYVDKRLSEAMEKILSQIDKGKTDGCLDIEDCWQMGHKIKAFYGYDEEEEYNIHDWDI